MDNYDVDGVHMDYIRYDSEDVCFCQRCRSGFKTEIGIDPIEIGKTAEFDVYSEAATANILPGQNGSNGGLVGSPNSWRSSQS